MRTITAGTWAEIRAAYLAGAGLRSLARRAGIAEGTVLAHAKREGWSKLKRQALSLVNGPQEAFTERTAQSVAIEAAERGQRHVALMQGLTEKLGSHAASLSPALLFDQVGRLNTLDLLARRSFGLETGSKAAVQVNVLTDSPCIAVDFPVFDNVEEDSTVMH